MKIIVKTIVPLALLLLAGTPAAAQPAELTPIEDLVERYAATRLALSGDDALEQPLSDLLEEAERLRDADPENPESWILCARIRFAYGDTQGMFRGLRLMKRARDEVDHAVSMDPAVMDGYGKAFLGYLYFGAPPWWRDAEKGYRLLDEAIAIADNTANNLYYAQVLTWDKRSEEARQRLLTAQSDPELDVHHANLRELYVRAIERGLAEWKDAQ